MLWFWIVRMRAMLARQSKVYDKKLLGVVSTKPGFLLSGPKDKNVISRAIALVGRVPVKISYGKW